MTDTTLPDGDVNSSPRPSRGRKPKGDAALGKARAFRLKVSEDAVFMAKVAASGLSASEFIRECVLTNRTQIVARQVASGDRKRIAFVVNKTGNNVNQLAHVANHARVSGKIDARLLEALLSELQQISQLLKASLNSVD